MANLNGIMKSPDKKPRGVQVRFEGVNSQRSPSLPTPPPAVRPHTEMLEMNPVGGGLAVMLEPGGVKPLRLLAVRAPHL